MGTGVPIVDAAMRCMNEMGWVHNQARKIAAMYLTKNLMVDWHVGERVSNFLIKVIWCIEEIPYIVFHAETDRWRFLLQQCCMAVVCRYRD